VIASVDLFEQKSAERENMKWTSRFLSPQAPLILNEIGPVRTKVGQPFNVQPDGQAALWLKMENATKTTVVIWGWKRLKTSFVNPNLLTALVTPKELYSKAGQYQIYSLDTKTEKTSNVLIFTVEE
jgi:hypothetical protein